MSEHTPGPWKAVRDPGHYHSLSTVVAGEPGKFNRRDRMRVEIGGWASPSEQEANTRLIAAAPDLLAALDELLHEHTAHLSDRTVYVERARAAIVRATGSEP